MADEDKAEELTGQKCPICGTDNLTLRESEQEIPYFGVVYLFSMTCLNCKYHKADVESAEERPGCKYTLEVSSEEDMKIRVVRSSEGKVVIPRIMTIEPGESAQGFITNVEGILMRAKGAIEQLRESADTPEEKKKAKNMLKKLQKVMWGQDKIKITIEDPSGNSAIVSEKAVKKGI
jgi:zinc finger protein